MKDLWVVQFGSEDAIASSTSFTKKHTAQRKTLENLGAVAFKPLPVKLGEFVMNRISRTLLTCALLVLGVSWHAHRISKGHQRAAAAQP
jgi:hypothetical protein